MNSAATKEVAIVLAAHGDRGGHAPNAILTMHAKALAERGIFHGVFAGTLKSPERPIEEALARAAASRARHVAVYPMFMADGYFTKQVLPERIAQAGLTERCRLLQPLGLDPHLPRLMLEMGEASARQFAIDPAATRLLIAGHGSKVSGASREATERAAEIVRQQRRFGAVETAFLEEAPFLDGALTSAGAGRGSRSGFGKTVVLGFFSGDGMHAAEDVPAAIERSGATAHYAGSIGRDAGVTRLIEAAAIAADWS